MVSVSAGATREPRLTKSMYRSLQAGRAAAALLVCIYHALGCITNAKYFNLPWAAAPFSWGMLAVEYFFVLSGFILFTVHQADLFKPTRFVPYALKRIIRIYPTYILIFLGVLIPALLIPSLRSTVPNDPLTLLSRLVLYPQQLQGFPTDGSPFNVIAVSWSLEYEVFFYTLFGLMLLGRTGAILLGLLLAWAFGSRILGFPLPRFGTFLSGPNTLTFIVGMAAAAIHRSGFRIPKPGWVTLVSLVLVFVLHGDHARPLWPNDMVRAIGTSLCSGLLVLGLTAGEECGLPSGRHPWIQRLGDASYALYLIHFPLISLLTKVAFATGLPRLGIAGAAVTLIVEVAVCIAVSVAFHLWLEKPIIAFLRRKTLPFTEPNKPATAPPTGAA